MIKSFTKKQVSNLLGITSRMVQYYTDEGFLIPEVANPSGKGTVRRYSKKNLFELLLLKRILTFTPHFDLKDIKKIMHQIQPKLTADEKIWNPEAEVHESQSNFRIFLLVTTAVSESPGISFNRNPLIENAKARRLEFEQQKELKAEFIPRNTYDECPEEAVFKIDMSWLAGAVIMDLTDLSKKVRNI